MTEAHALKTCFSAANTEQKGLIDALARCVNGARMILAHGMGHQKSLVAFWVKAYFRGWIAS